MNVLMLVQRVDSHAPNGFIVKWIKTLANRVDSLVVLTYFYSDSEDFPPNVKLVKISGNNFINRNIDLFLKTLEIIKKEDIDIVFGHILEVFGVVAGLCSRILGKKSFLWYCQGYDLSKNYLAKLSLLLPHKILTCGQRVKDQYIRQVGGWMKNKTVPVGHGIDLAHYSQGQKPKTLAKDQKVTVVYAGRIAPIKDIGTLIEAVRIMHSNGYNIELNIHGGWGIIDSQKMQYRDIILKKVAEVNKSEQFVNFPEGKSHGYADNYKIIKSGNIFIMPTLSTSLDIVYIEAIACGVLAVGSDVGYPFMVQKFPQLVFKAQDPYDLAKKIRWLIDNPKKAHIIIQNAKAYVEKQFDINKLMDKVAYEFSLA